MTTQTNQKNLNDIFFQQKTTGVNYNDLLEEVQKYLSDNHAKAISSGGNDASVLIKNIIKQYLIKQRYAVDGYTAKAVCFCSSFFISLYLYIFISIFVSLYRQKNK